MMSYPSTVVVDYKFCILEKTTTTELFCDLHVAHLLFTLAINIGQTSK